MYPCECQNCQGVITYIRNDTTADVENQIKQDNPTHVQKVTVWEDNKKFSIYNIYSPPGTVCKIEDPLYSVLPGMGSDHRPILINLPRAQTQSQQQRLRWNFKKARWNDYARCTDEEFKKINLENEGNPDTLEEKIQTIITEASKKNIPRGFQKKYKPFWNSEIDAAVAKRHEARTALEQTPNITNKIAYNKASAKVQQTILQGKRNKWQTSVSNIDLRKNGREAWTLLNNLSGNKRQENPRPMPEGETSKKKAELLNKHFYTTNQSRNDKNADEQLLRELKQREKEKRKR